MMLMFLCVAPPARAEVPQHFTLNVQVFETDDPFGFSYQGAVQVDLFDSAVEGNLMWSEVHQNVSIDFGFMSVALGSVNLVTPLGEVLTANSGTPLFLEVTLGKLGETLPGRIELTSVPFALACSQAGNAVTLEGKSAGAFSLAGHMHTTAVLTDWPSEFPPAAHEHKWTDLISGVPTEFPTEAHPHPWSDLLGVPGVLGDELVSWSEVQDKPTVFAPAVHDHAGVYLSAAGKAVDADKLDGLDSAELATKSDMAGVEGLFDGYYTKQEVGDALAAALAPLQAELWCLKNCDAAKLGDCKQRTCDGVGQKCTEAGAVADGTSCQGGGRCQGGKCCAWASWGFDCAGDGSADWTGTTCGGVACPVLGGYVQSCNGKEHCEYANVDSSGWKKWDVWIWVAPGTFQMGSEGEGGGSDEVPVHPVTLSKGYFIGKYEIVVAQYEACKAALPGKCTPADTTDWPGTQGTNTSGGGKGEHPQNGLTWQQAKDFCGWVAPGGRLPSEAEWEYAATGPVHLKYPWGNSPDPTCDNDTAVFNEAGGVGGYGCSQGGTWKAGSKTAGASWSGALDMSGNLWEWNEDWYHNTYSGAPADGSAWVDPSGSTRVLRGGGFSHDAVNMRSAKRSSSTPGNRGAHIGARCWRPFP